MRTIVRRVEHDRILGDTELVEFCEQIPDLAIVVDHGIRVEILAGDPANALGNVGAEVTLTRTPSSRRAKAIETGRIIRPLGIAEEGGSVGESVGADWNTDGIDQVRASFDHNDQVTGPGDGEPELIR